MLQHSQDSNEQPSLDPIQSFTQEDINNGRVLYLHSKPEDEHDQFVVDITASGADRLEGVVVNLAVLPITIPLDVHNITVPGGGSVTLSTGILNIPNAYFTSLGVELRVLEPPRFGTLLSSKRPEDGGLRGFTWSEVEQPSMPACPPHCFPGGGGKSPGVGSGRLGRAVGLLSPWKIFSLGMEGVGVAKSTWTLVRAGGERISSQGVFKRLLPMGTLPQSSLPPPRLAHRSPPQQGWWPCAPQEGHPASAPQVENQRVQYRQDGRRAQADSFTLLANSSALERRSQPRTIFVSILPRTSQGPRLRVNAGLQVRAGCRGDGHPPQRDLRGAQRWDTQRGGEGGGQPGVGTRSEPWPRTPGNWGTAEPRCGSVRGGGGGRRFPGGARLRRRRRPECPSLLTLRVCPPHPSRCRC